METWAAIDFETSGLSPDRGDRAIEIGIVAVEGERVLDSFSSLMNPGFRISPFIESYTGITNAMLKTAPPVDEVMRKAARFVGNLPLAAHNAGFDRRFWAAEMGRVHAAAEGEFLCTMLLARRVFPESPDHKLGTLKAHLRIRATGAHHRALHDAAVAAGICMQAARRLRAEHGLAQVDHAILRRISRLPLSRVGESIARMRE